MNNHFPYQPEMGEATMLKKICNGELFGLVECDVHVPDYLKPLFEDFPPLFKMSTCPERISVNT